MNILMVSPHFNLPGDAVPIGGVQKHIVRVTRELEAMGHRVVWQYKRLLDADLLTWADYIVAHDFVSFIEGAGKPQLLIFHGYEGQCPPHPFIVQTRQEISAKAGAIIQVGEFIGHHYGTPADATIYGAVEEPPLLGDFIPETALFLGSLAPYTFPEMAFDLAMRMRWKLSVCGDGGLRERLAYVFPEAVYHGFVVDPSKHIASAEYVLVGGFLSSLEAMIQRRLPIALYGNNIRRDYYELFPGMVILAGAISEMLARLNSMADDERAAIIEHNYHYAKAQTWRRVADLYLQLFEKARLHVH